MGIEGPDLVFFGRWSAEGGIPMGNRVPRERVLQVTTDAASHDPRDPSDPTPLFPFS
jgi:hypothetical protein